MSWSGNIQRSQALENARLEVAMYESAIERFLSVHKAQVKAWDWEKILNASPPTEPVRGNHRSAPIEAAQAAYRPSFFDKLFGKAANQTAVFAAQLQMTRAQDEREFQDAWTQYQARWVDWENKKKLAASIIAGEHDGYVRALRGCLQLDDLSEFGSSIDFRISNAKLLEATIHVRGGQVIPTEIKTLTATGKASSRAMPKLRYQEIFQDYVCGFILRVGREALALLPADKIIVTALTDILDTRTGTMAEQAIISVVIPRWVLEHLEFDRLDPSDAMENFLHRGEFKTSRKTGAFLPITPLSAADLENPAPSVPSESKPGMKLSPSWPSDNPLPARWIEASDQHEIQAGFLRLTVNELAMLLGRSCQDNFTLAQSKELTRMVESFNFCLEPDPRNGCGNFWGNREIGIFPPSDGFISGVSEEFRGAAAMLQLCILVAAADGTIDRKEVDHFWKFVDGRFKFSADERQRLIILETLLCRNASPAKIILNRLTKSVSSIKKFAIGQFLVDVAAADGVITESEYQTLKRIFEVLGHSEESLQTVVRSAASHGTEIVIQLAEFSPSGESIPPPKSNIPHIAPAFKLDMKRIAAISAETNDVIGLLANAMKEDDSHVFLTNQDFTVSKPVPATFDLPRPAPVSARALTRFDGLDQKWQPIAEQLVQKASWKRTEFDQLAREHRFMPLNVLDAVNEWADQHLGDFLIEGDDPVTVHCSMLKNS